MSAKNLAPAALEYLAAIGAADVPHSGRKLVTHLQGTYELLTLWKCEEAVCLAGLFHSVYGTSSFDGSRLAVSTRNDVAARIGARAEQLVYLFSVAIRPNGILRAVENGRIVSRFDAKEILLSQEQANDLLAIECANLMEQGDSSLVEAITKLDRASVEVLLGQKTGEMLLGRYQPGREKTTC